MPSNRDSVAEFYLCLGQILALSGAKDVADTLERRGCDAKALRKALNDAALTAYVVDPSRGVEISDRGGGQWEATR